MFSDNNSRPDISGSFFKNGSSSNVSKLFVKHDKKFIPMEFIFLFAVLLPALLILFFSYSNQLNDPVVRQKQFLLELSISCMVISIILTVFVTFTSYKKRTLTTGYKILTVLSILAIALLLGLKIYMNKYFTPQAIAKYYDKTQSSNIESNKSTPLNFAPDEYSKTGEDLKAAYIQESLHEYTYYSHKLWVVILLYLIYVFDMFYFVYRASHIETLKKNLGKNNKIVVEQETEKKV